MSHRSQNQSEAAEPSQFIDPRLLTMMDDERYFGDLSSRASPFSSAGIPSEAQVAPVTPTPAPIHQTPLPGNPDSPIYGQVNLTAQTAATGSSVHQLTPNPANTPRPATTPRPAVRSTAQNAYSARLNQPAPIRTAPSTHQFRSAPYASRNPQSSARHLQQFVTRPAPHPSAAAPNGFDNQYLASSAGYFPPVTAPASSFNYQLTPPATGPASGAGLPFGAHPTGLNYQQFNPDNSYLQGTAASTNTNNQQFGSYTQGTAVPTRSNNHQLTSATAGTPDDTILAGFNIQQQFNSYNQGDFSPTGFNSQQLNSHNQRSAIPTEYGTNQLNSHNQGPAVPTGYKVNQLTSAPAGPISGIDPTVVNNQQPVSYTGRTRTPVAPVPAGLVQQQLAFQSSYVSPAASGARRLGQQSGPHPSAQSAVKPGARQQLGQTPAEKIIGFIRFNPAANTRITPVQFFPLRRQPAPQNPVSQKPSPTDSDNTGIPTPKKTPYIDKPKESNPPVTSRPSTPSAMQNNHIVHGADAASPRNNLAAQAGPPAVVADESPSKIPTLAELEAELLVDIPDEVEKLDAQEHFKKASENADNVCAGSQMGSTCKDKAIQKFVSRDEKTHNERAGCWLGKENAWKDLGSEVYHSYIDQDGFMYLEICLTRVDLVKNTNERVLLSIYETDFHPANYITFVKYINGSDDDASTSEILANGTDMATAFREFRKAFKKYTRISWEARSIPQEYITRSAAAWEKQKLDQIMFDKFGEQSGRRSPSPDRNGQAMKSKKRVVGGNRSEDHLTEEELERCKVRRFKYTPPPPGFPQGMSPGLPGEYPVIPGDDPMDGGWTLVIH